MQILRPRRFWLQFSAQGVNADSEVLSVVGVVWPPDFFQDLTMSQDFAGMLYQKGQEFELQRGETDFFIFDKDFAAD